MIKIIHFDLTNMILNGNYADNAVADIVSSNEFPYEIEIIAENLYVPWAIDISEDGVLYFTERSGNIRTIENGILNSRPIIVLQFPFVSRGEGGLMGIALDPDYLQNHYIYIMYSYMEGSQIYNRVVRLLNQNGKTYIDKILFDRIPGGQIHNGGRIKIGPDQKLYVTTGDAGNPSLAQDLSSTAGKILRIELDGSIPADNPFRNSPVYSYGHRNPQGLAWDSENVLYASEHGATAHDEINRIRPGGNYGWPLVQGDEDTAEIQIQKPVINSGGDTWAPSGMSFINQGAWNGKLLVAALRGQQLLSFTFNEERTEITGLDSWLRNEFGRIREVIQAKDGSIYITTSNRDGRGNLYEGDDKIIRLIPKDMGE